MTLVYKILLLGDAAVGKTSIIHKYIENKISDSYSATIGVDIMNTVVKINDGVHVSLNIWDIAGQTHFEMLRKKFYLGAEAGIVIFDVTRPETYEHIKEWIKETNIELKEKIPMILVGNKIDLTDQRKITYNEFVQDKEHFSNVFEVYETSALTGEGINQVFLKIAEKLVEIYQKNPD